MWCEGEMWGLLPMASNFGRHTAQQFWSTRKNKLEQKWVSLDWDLPRIVHHSRNSKFSAGILWSNETRQNEKSAINHKTKKFKFGKIVLFFVSMLTSKQHVFSLSRLSACTYLNTLSRWKKNKMQIQGVRVVYCLPSLLTCSSHPVIYTAGFFHGNGLLGTNPDTSVPFWFLCEVSSTLVAQRDASKWDLLLSMGVSTLQQATSNDLRSNLRRASSVDWVGPYCSHARRAVGA